MIEINLINNAGEGFAGRKQVQRGTTIEKFFDDVNGGDVEDFRVRVNRTPVTADYVLKDGDTVSITPTKMTGGTR